ncbi:MAG TPA: COX15/CtaA family protein, partial [Gemmatimonadaceae bacterium]|nr:COX15/CtaA family protein [Gemmatimonadaceae bacterium]
ALTAHVPGANTACGGFPLCDGRLYPSIPAQHVQYTHRVIALLVLLHMGGLAVQVQRRGETRVLALTRLTFGAVVLQVLLAAFLVELNLPLVLRSMHEALGTLIWLLVVSLAIVAQRNAHHSARTEVQGPVGSAAEVRA